MLVTVVGIDHEMLSRTPLRSIGTNVAKAKRRGKGEGEESSTNIPRINGL
jgi:hypothetical protein